LDGGGRELRSLGVNFAGKWFEREAAGEDKRVLPRFLRRPARILSRIDWHASHYWGIKGLAMFVAATALAGVVFGGHTRAVVSSVTAASGLAIDQVKITGQSETSEVNILDSLEIEQFESLFTFDLDAARERVEALPWVARATLRKLYPDTLEVAVSERLPYALWQNGDTVSLIDPQGTVISDYIGERYTSLPLVVGPGANTRVDEFLDLVLSQPSLVPRVRAGVLVSERRWNIVFAGAIEIMLPEIDPAAALARVADLDDEHRLLSREIAAVDLRLPDRLVVRLTEHGLAERRSLIEARDKLARKRGTST
jgi:cell division protein FtsQ